MSQPAWNAAALRRSLLALLLGSLGAAVFVPSVSGGWLWDDHSLIETNPWVHGLGGWRGWLTHHVWKTDLESGIVENEFRLRYWRPLVTASYALDWRLGGGQPWVFHVTNLCWHALTSALAYLTLLRWLPAPGFAWLAALLFAVHPTKAESVAWISGRTDLLCSAGIFLAARGCSLRLEGRRAGYGVEAAGTLMAYMAKETAIVLPAFIAVERWAALRRPALEAGVLRSVLRTAVPHLLLAFLYLALHALLLPIKHVGDGAFSWSWHALRVVETLGYFAQLTLAPSELSVQRGLLELTADGLPVIAVAPVAAGVVCLVGSVAALVMLRRRSPGAALGLLLFVLTLSPVSNVVETSMPTLVSERFLYLPVFGPVWVLAEVATEFRRRARAWDLRWASAVPAVVIGGLAAACTLSGARHAGDFVDDTALWQRERALHPRSWTAWTSLATAAFDRHDYGTAARLAQEGYAAIDGRVAPGAKLRLGVLAAEAWSLRTPDLYGQRLEALRRFFAVLRTSQAEPARLSLPEARLAVRTTDPRYRPSRASLEPRLLIAEAELSSRRGADRGALSLIDRALALCSPCGSYAGRVATVLARAGSTAAALRVLDRVAAAYGEEAVADTRRRVLAARMHALLAERSRGPVALQQEALRLSTLGAYGRAYLVLAPYREAIAESPAMAPGFAELAWRAGARDVAVEVLRGTVAPPEIARRTREWSRAMGWLPPVEGPADTRALEVTADVAGEDVSADAVGARVRRDAAGVEGGGPAAGVGEASRVGPPSKAR